MRTEDEMTTIENEKKGSKEFLMLSDGTIVNINDIILVNVEGSGKDTEYRLYLRGKKMTLKLSINDYDIIRNSIL